MFERPMFWQSKLYIITADWINVKCILIQLQLIALFLNLNYKEEFLKTLRNLVWVNSIKEGVVNNKSASSEI